MIIEPFAGPCSASSARFTTSTYHAGKSAAWLGRPFVLIRGPMLTEVPATPQAGLGSDGQVGSAGLLAAARDAVDEPPFVVADVQRAVRADRKTRWPAERIDVTIPQEAGGERLRIASGATVPG